MILTQEQANAIAETKYPDIKIPPTAFRSNGVQLDFHNERIAYARCLMDVKPLIEAGAMEDKIALSGAGQASSPPSLHIGVEPIAWMRRTLVGEMSIIGPTFKKENAEWYTDYDIPLFANAHTKSVSIDHLAEAIEDLLSRNDLDDQALFRKIRAVLLKLTQQP